MISTREGEDDEDDDDAGDSMCRHETCSAESAQGNQNIETAFG